MAVDSIGAVQTSANPATQTAGLTQQDFLKVLLTQLQFQDPLKPMDNQQFLAQTAQFTQLQLTRESNDSLSSMLSFMSGNQAIGLIGKTVEVQTPTGNQVGQVTTVGFQSGIALLTVQTSSGGSLNGIPLSQISVVR